MAELKNMKITSLAKELSIKPKDIVKILGDRGTEKGTSATLTLAEVNLVLHVLSSMNEIPDINAYISGEMPLRTPEKVERIKAAEKAAAEKAAAEKAAAEKAAAEKAAAEKVAAKKAATDKAAAKKAATDKAAAEKAATDKAAAEKATAKKAAAKKAVAEKAVAEKTGAKKVAAEKTGAPEQAAIGKPNTGSGLKSNVQSRKSFADRVNEARLAADKEKAKALEKKNRNSKKREEKKDEKKIAFTTRADFTFDATTKKDVIIVDTKGAEVDLSKYDDKNFTYDFVGNEGKPKRSTGNRSGQRSGYKRKNDRNRKSAPLKVQLPTSVQLPETMIVSELARELRITTSEVMKKLMSLGQIVTLNQSIDYDTAAIIADEFGVHAQPKVVVTIEEKLIDETHDTEEELKPRSPVVVVMGHVDHGKTSLLDAIRDSNVTAGEAGGITQHIGAYNVTLPSGRKITFLDTPGHEAFTAMRARGAQATDIAIIIIAADDSVMPTTREAIAHCQAAGVPMVFAINKIDKPGANSDRIREDLANMNLLVEEWGGKFQCQEISAKKGLGVDELLEKVLLEADMLDLKANPNRKSTGTVIESSLDKGRGFVSTVLVSNGTLQVGDYMIAGTSWGRIKAMFNERNQRIDSAAPSEPCIVLGLDGAPTSGDLFHVLETEQEVRDIANKREQLQREQSLRTQTRLTLSDISHRIARGEFHEMNIIVKGDTDGSIEALSDSFIKLSTDKVQVNVIFKAVGQISENDVTLADASDAIIVGFQVRPSAAARKLAEADGVDINTYSVIYDAIDDVKDAMQGMLDKVKKEIITAQVEVRQVYKISKVGTVAGALVTEGKVHSKDKARVVRDGIVVHTAPISTLKRYKDDVKEVVTGMECGIALRNYNDIQEGDILETFTEIEVEQKL